MGVQDEFKEENFMRVTRRTNTARVLAHFLAPQLHAILGRSSGTPQVEAIAGQGWSNFTLKVSFKNEPRDFILRLSEKAPTAEARLCRSVPHLEKEYAILSQLQGFSFVPKLLSGGIGSIVLDIPGKGYTEYSTQYLGMPQVIKPDGLYFSQQRFGLYRWHLLDPIYFSQPLRVEIQALGWRSGWRYLPLQDDIASTSFFYLDKPSTNRPQTPTADTMEIHLGKAPVPDLGRNL